MTPVEDTDPARADKMALRTRFLGSRAVLSDPERGEASARVCRMLVELPELAGVRAVLGYASFGTELRVDAYLQHLMETGAGVFLPWVEGERLEIARVRDLAADLAPGWGGVREPRVSGRRAARPDRLDAAVVPGVAFDRTGGRLGYGGGHFDRLLAALAPDAVTVGVCFGVQLAEQLPMADHDRRVDVVVTEQEVIRSAASK